MVAMFLSNSKASGKVQCQFNNALSSLNFKFTDYLTAQTVEQKRSFVRRQRSILLDKSSSIKLISSSRDRFCLLSIKLSCRQ